jgi:hypothetical protein
LKRTGTLGLLVLCLGLAFAQPNGTSSPDPHGHYTGDGHYHEDPHGHYAGDGHNHDDPHGHYAGDGHDHEDPHGHYAGDGHDHEDPHGHHAGDEHNREDPHGHYAGDGHDHAPTRPGGSTPGEREDLAVPDDTGHSHEGHNHSNDFVPSAQDASMPAVFGYMILATRAEKVAGTNYAAVLGMSRAPWAATALLLPIYVLVARRRGFRLRRRT